MTRALRPPRPVSSPSSISYPASRNSIPSELAKYFKAFADSRETKYARADHHTEPKEQNYLRNQSSRYESRENRCCHSAERDSEQ